MRVLHLLSQRELTGAEVYALALAARHAQAGHHCIVASDRLNVRCDLPFHAVPLGDRRWHRRVSNIAAIRRLVREERIDVMHAHSRAASWIANAVSRLTGTAYVSTVHGRQSVHFTSRKFNVYGQYVITICPHLTEHLAEELQLPKQRLRCIPNGV